MNNNNSDSISSSRKENDFQTEINTEESYSYKTKPQTDLHTCSVCLKKFTKAQSLEKANDQSMNRFQEDKITGQVHGILEVKAAFSSNNWQEGHVVPIDVNEAESINEEIGD